MVDQLSVYTIGGTSVYTQHNEVGSASKMDDYWHPTFIQFIQFLIILTNEQFSSKNGCFLTVFSYRGTERPYKHPQMDEMDHPLLDGNHLLP